MSELPWIITCEELRQELKEHSLTLVDVREEEELADGQIGGEISVPLSDFMAKYADALPDHDANIVIYCAHGVRSMHALRALQQLGYTRLRSLDGGMCAWLES